MSSNGSHGRKWTPYRIQATVPVGSAIARDHVVFTPQKIESAFLQHRHAGGIIRQIVVDDFSAVGASLFFHFMNREIEIGSTGTPFSVAQDDLRFVNSRAFIGSSNYTQIGNTMRCTSPALDEPCLSVPIAPEWYFLSEGERNMHPSFGETTDIWMACVANEQVSFTIDKLDVTLWVERF